MLALRHASYKKKEKASNKTQNPESKCYLLLKPKTKTKQWTRQI